ncbi:crotonobetainyl-CoA:carnitine CoA-transferase CaiB-like acyl-CoA transferase [Herbaspirillum sp. Sphag1AN]|uniref:CoA transferase n=1 Tax=unclassified Herbaspirillum TaxID=2624150 RepID=UPI00161B669D|nr:MULTISPECIES: CoA transferase [unclassified Herbaspirillum]MBB3213291.1 crotonobetainyl-CoA:carnitine CoA-transferase CaiB-like acyl-CoA transferase [Herbaspirillum sp. Sphag1AN]MBB3246665.1 crotonobetainyl-CoA:carnitine CoA-transferase CaiB-like acyl-CoA transferase [Herbaspirillum sp. Sphag64]
MSASQLALDVAPGVTRFLHQIWHAVGGDALPPEALRITGSGSLPSAFAVSDLAAATVSAAGLAVAELLQVAGASSKVPLVQADRRLASYWFATSLRPQGWQVPPVWDAVAGDYQTADGWIRLHTNAIHHRDAALAVLQCAVDQQQVAQAVRTWQGEQLESAIVAQGGCAAVMRDNVQWRQHPQGAAVTTEPLLHVERAVGAQPLPAHWCIAASRPLQGVKVLDLTRVLAGPTATRFLAGFGAEVLRIDSPTWDEPGVVPEMTLGKRCARLDLRTSEGQARLTALLAQADVLVHGYRGDALPGLGFDAVQRRRINPGLVDVSLNAYGWTGPWQNRRGFDSLVQMSSGIAQAGMLRFGRDRPIPLPVQALDYGAGYLLAMAAVRGLTERLRTGQGSCWRTSLARVAHLLVTGSGTQHDQDAPLASETAADCAPSIEQTSWGTAQRLIAPVQIGVADMRWQYPAGPLGVSPAQW